MREGNEMTSSSRTHPQNARGRMMEQPSRFSGARSSAGSQATFLGQKMAKYGEASGKQKKIELQLECVSREREREREWERASQNQQPD